MKKIKVGLIALFVSLIVMPVAQADNWYEGMERNTPDRPAVNTVNQNQTIVNGSNTSSKEKIAEELEQSMNMAQMELSRSQTTSAGSTAPQVVTVSTGASQKVRFK